MNGQNLENVQCVFGKNDKINQSKNTAVVRVKTLP